MFKKINKPTDRQSRRSLDSNAPPRSKAFSYYDARTPRDTKVTRRSVNDKPELKRSTPHWWRHLPTWIAIVAVIVCVVYELRLSTDPRIIIVDSNSNTNLFLQSPIYYEKSIQAILNSSSSNKNKLMINTANLTNKLKNEYPEISNVSIVLPVLGNRPLVYLDPAQPAIILDSQSSGDFVLDSTGKVLMDTTDPIKLMTLKLPTVVDQTGYTVKVGDIALPSTYIAFIGSVVSQLQAKQIAIQSINLPSASEELDVHINGVPYFVKFNLNDNSDASQQIGTFLAARQYLSQNNITPSQYIDARVLGRVYYK